MKRKTLLLVLMLTPFVLSFGQPANVLASVLDPAIYFPCSASVLNDCASAWNVYDAATGQQVARVLSTTWTALPNGSNEAVTPIPPGSRRYKNAYFARVEITHFDGEIEESGDSNIVAARRPIPPPVLVQR